MSLEVAGTIRQKKIGLSLASRWGWNLPAPPGSTLATVGGKLSARLSSAPCLRRRLGTHSASTRCLERGVLSDRGFRRGRSTSVSQIPQIRLRYCSDKKRLLARIK